MSILKRYKSNIVFCVLILFSTLSRSESLADLVEKVAPSVLSIHTQILNPQNKPSKKSKGSQYSSALGTGFVVMNEGPSQFTKGLSSFLVLTNFHVIEGAQSVEVVTQTDNTYPARIVGRDGRNDIAVLRVDMPNSTVLKIKPSKNLRVGDALFAIGNPYGLSHTVTHGILSAKDRSLGVGAIDRYLQTNVAINFGNSGGPLFDYSGQVVGITTLGKTDGQGLGFAIPSDTILKLLPRLSSGEKYQRAWIGISALQANKALVSYFQKNSENQPVGGVALVVVGVHAKSPAAKLGIKKGDIIWGVFQGEELKTFPSAFELKNILETLNPGELLELKIQRSPGKFFKARLTLEAAPEESEYYDFD